MSVDFVLKLSLMEQFSVRDGDSGDVSAVPVSLAPVIAFLVFYHYDFCADRPLKQIKLDILFKPIKKPGDLSSSKLAVDLYYGLCRAYGDFYGDRYHQDIQDEWDAAFIVYAGCHTLYPAGVSAGENAENRLGPFCFAGVSNCLASNQASLAHNWLYQKTGALDHFDLERQGEPGLKVFSFFRKTLLHQDRVQADSCLKNFLAFLQCPYSPGAIQDFLMGCVDRILIGIGKQKRQLRKLDDVESTLKLILPDVKDQKVRMCAVLEYTMRRILTERCEERLYGWLFDYFDWQFAFLQGDIIDKAPGKPSKRGTS